MEFTLRANESCFDKFEFLKTLRKVLKLFWMFTIMQISVLKVHFAQLNGNWRKWTYFRIIVWLLVQMIACFPLMKYKRCIRLLNIQRREGSLEKWRSRKLKNQQIRARENERKKIRGKRNPRKINSYRRRIVIKVV